MMSDVGAERARRFLVVTIGLLAAADIARSAWVPSDVHLAFNIGLVLVVALIAWFAGLSLAELGLEREHLGSGLRWGGAAFGAVAVAVTATAIVGSSSGLFDDDRSVISGGELARKVLFVIPVGTVVLEELAFRGVVLGLWRRSTPTWRAVSGASLVFGLWHVPGAWKSAIGDGAWSALATAAGTVVATTAAGVVFNVLRLKSRSLVGPALAHLATNTIPLVAAWWINR
jgi:membrane protease YdiL (CAAX protease family)